MEEEESKKNENIGKRRKGTRVEVRKDEESKRSRS